MIDAPGPRLLRRCGSRTTRAVCLALLLLLVAPGSAFAQVVNPGWSGTCPQRIALVLDQSSSMEAFENEVDRAAEDLLDALRGAPNELSLITFGTEAHVAVEAADMSDDGERRALKDRIGALQILTDNAGGTNWEAALESARTLDPDLVVLVTDGQPSVHGVPVNLTSAPDDPLNLSAAVAAADRLQEGGSRVVGVGIGLVPGAEANLAAVTGPEPDDDYYTTGVHDLLPILYDVASKACGIPVAALPQPEPRSIPLVPILVGGGVALAGVVAGGFLLARRRGELAVRPAATAPRAERLQDPSIGLDDLPPAPVAPPDLIPDRDVGSRVPDAHRPHLDIDPSHRDHRGLGEDVDPDAGPRPGGVVGEGPRRPPRRISLAPDADGRRAPGAGAGPRSTPPHRDGGGRAVPREEGETR